MLIRQLPAGSATHVAQRGPAASWAPGDYLLARVVDQLAAANWQRSGGKGQRPKPLPRPGEAATVDRIGGDAMSIDEFETRWNARQQAEG